jgi:hypothetical protein
MPAKGHAAKGLGQARWKHGWIPANAAARAIVAARKAKAADRRHGEESSSPSVNGPIRHTTRKLSDGKWVVIDPNGKQVAVRPSPTLAEDAARSRDRLWVYEHGRLPTSDEQLQVKLRTQDPETGTPSLFRGRRDIIQPADTSQWLTDYPKLDPGRTATDDLINSNPHFYASPEDDPDATKPYQINCYNCVQAYELRRRGYAVEAKGAPIENWYTGMGQSDGEIAEGWTLPDGSRSHFTDVQAMGLLNEVMAWPKGSRGWIVTAWKDGGGHVWVVEKGDDGVPHFIDPQPGKEINIQDYLNRSTGNFKIMKVDDLVPTVHVADRVDKSTNTGPAFRPTDEVFRTSISDTPAKALIKEQHQKLMNERLALGDAPNKEWDRKITDAKIQALETANGETVRSLQKRILDVETGIEMSQDMADHGELGTKDLEDLRLAKIKLQVYRDVLAKAAPNAGDFMVTGAPEKPGQKVVKRWQHQ